MHKEPTHSTFLNNPSVLDPSAVSLYQFQAWVTFDNRAGKSHVASNKHRVSIMAVRIRPPRSETKNQARHLITCDRNVMAFQVTSKASIKIQPPKSCCRKNYVISALTSKLLKMADGSRAVGRIIDRKSVV